MLDYHGDPVNSDFCLLSDGNHHMALNEAINAFADSEPNMRSIFYVTLPPPELKSILQAGSIALANLQFPVSANMIISPSAVLDQLHLSGVCGSPQSFIGLKGYAWLVAKSNPKQFNSIDDLMRDDVRLFLSNPKTEKMSYMNYKAALQLMCLHEPGLHKAIEKKMDSGQGIKWGECIHHREAPESITQGLSDVSLVYYHLALRYTRIFPQQFELLITPELEALNQQFDPSENQIQLALIEDGGTWGKRAASFFQSQKVADIYRYHGITSIKN